VLLPLALSGVVLFGVPVPLLFGIWPCGFSEVGADVVFGLPALGVSAAGAAVFVFGVVDIELPVASFDVAPFDVAPFDIEPLLIELPLAAPVLPGLESCS
jgi:hypothetical protein